MSHTTHYDANLDFNSTNSNKIEWEIGSQIGVGGSGRVFVGMNTETGAKIAIKELDSKSLFSQTLFNNKSGKEQPLKYESFAHLQKEITIMKKLSHKNIVQYLGTDFRYINHKVQMYILLEYASGGSLRDMYCEWGPINTQIIREYSKQILEGLSYLHNYHGLEEEGIIHRDIKCANILVNENGIIKLADFGCSKQFEGKFSLSETTNSHMFGTIPWMAPEAINHAKQHVGRKSDIWSFACTIIEMATATRPWPNTSDIFAIMNKITGTNELPYIPSNLSDIGIDFLKICLQRDQTKRWNSVQLLEHPFITLNKKTFSQQQKSANNNNNNNNNNNSNNSNNNSNGMSFSPQLTSFNIPPGKQHKINNVSTENEKDLKKNISRKKSFSSDDSNLIIKLNEKYAIEFPSGTPFIVACEEERIKDIRRYIEIGKIDINLKGKDSTGEETIGLHAAIWEGSVYVVDYLLKNPSIDVAIVDVDKWNLFHFALKTENKSIELIKLLLNNSSILACDVINGKDKNGETPLDYANKLVESDFKKDVQSLLQTKGAKVGSSKDL